MTVPARPQRNNAFHSTYIAERAGHGMIVVRAVGHIHAGHLMMRMIHRLRISVACVFVLGCLCFRRRRMTGVRGMVCCLRHCRWREEDRRGDQC